MKRFKLKRISSSTLVTMGVLIDEKDGIPVCVTLELPDLGNQKNISCIPTGIYHCSYYISERFGQCYRVNSVPNRSDIIIHTGNTVGDIQGCILPGVYYGSYKKLPAVLQSRRAVLEIFSRIGKHDFELIITD